ncbi:MAG: response regulator [Flavobacteriales bacterium]
MKSITFFLLLIIGMIQLKANSDFRQYYDSVHNVILEKSKEQFAGDMQILARDLIDTLEKVNYSEKPCLLSEIYASLSLSYVYNDRPRAKTLMNKSFENARECENVSYLIMANNNYAIFQGSGRFEDYLDSTVYYFEKAEELSHLHNNDTILLDIYMNLSRCYLYQKKFSKFKTYLDKTKKDLIVNSDSSRAAVYYELMAEYEVHNDPSKVLDNFEKCLEWTARSNVSKQITIHSKMVSFCKDNKLYKQAVEYYTKLYKLRRFNQIQKFNTRYDNLVDQHEMQKSKDDLANLELKNTYIQKAADDQKAWNYLLLISVAILLLGLSFYIKLYRNQQKLSIDLTDKNKKLKQAEETALELLEIKTQFTNTISHELRTPLHGIIGLTSILIEKEKQNLSEEGGKYLDNLKYSGEYLLTLINDVLEMSKIDSKAIELEHKSFHLEFFVSNLSSAFKNLAVESNNQFNISIDSNIPRYIKGDPIRLSQILINLIGNALKFTKNGEVELNVNLKSNIENQVNILFEVKDNGPGIPKDKQNSIFDKFIQIRNQTSNQTGTGLGLPIVKKLLQLFNSEIQLESQLGSGTTFFFEIEFEIGEKGEIDLQNSEQENLNQFGVEKGHLLIVDDNEINLIVSQKILELNGYQVETCLDGETALEKLETNHFDIVLLDLHMPKMDGVETIREIRKTNVNIPVILISASNVANDWNTYSKEGFSDFIIKPYDKFDFLTKVMKYIKSKKTA